MKTKLKTKCNMHKDLSNNSATMSYYQQNENIIHKTTRFTQHDIQQYLQYFDNNIIVQVDNGNAKTKQIQSMPNVCRSQGIQIKSQ